MSFPVNVPSSGGTYADHTQSCTTFAGDSTLSVASISGKGGFTSGNTLSVTALLGTTATIVDLNANWDASYVGLSITISNTNSSGNSGTFLITTFVTSTSLKITNATAVAPDANNGEIQWYVEGYVTLTDTAGGFLPTYVGHNIAITGAHNYGGTWTDLSIASMTARGGFFSSTAQDYATVATLVGSAATVIIGTPQWDSSFVGQNIQFYANTAGVAANIGTFPVASYVSNYSITVTNANAFVGATVSTTASNSGLVQITTTAATTLATGDTVAIIGILGTVEANGTWTITVIDSQNFTLNGSTFSNPYTSGGVINDAGAGSLGWIVHGFVTITSPTAVFDPEIVGSYINITGATSTGGGDSTLSVSTIQAGGTTVTPSAVSSITVSGSVVTVNNTTATFDSTYVGLSITISNADYAPNNGVYLITGFTDANDIIIDNPAAATDPNNGTIGISITGWVVLTDSSANWTPNYFGQNITISGANSGGNDGTFTIQAVLSPTSIAIQNGSAVAPDANNGAITWSVNSLQNNEYAAVYSYISPTEITIQNPNAAVPDASNGSIHGTITDTPNDNNFTIYGYVSANSITIQNLDAIAPDLNNGAITWGINIVVSNVAADVLGGIVLTGTPASYFYYQMPLAAWLKKIVNQTGQYVYVLGSPETGAYVVPPESNYEPLLSSSLNESSLWVVENPADVVQGDFTTENGVGALVLIQTTTQTGTFNPYPNNSLQLVDASGGAATINMDTGPEDGETWAFKDPNASWATNTVTFQAGSGQMIEGPIGTYSAPGGTVVWNTPGMEVTYEWSDDYSTWLIVCLAGLGGGGGGEAWNVASLDVSAGGSFGFSPTSGTNQVVFTGTPGSLVSVLITVSTNYAFEITNQTTFTVTLTDDTAAGTVYVAANSSIFVFSDGVTLQQVTVVSTPQRLNNSNTPFTVGVSGAANVNFNTFWVNTQGSPFSFTLPAASVIYDGYTINIKDNVGSWGTGNLTVTQTDGSTIEDPEHLGGSPPGTYASSVVLSAPGGGVTYQYGATENVWFLV